MNNLNATFMRTLIAAQNSAEDLKERAADERGAVMAEYGLLLALIAVAIITTLVLFKDSLISVFTDANTALDGRGVPAAPAAP